MSSIAVISSFASGAVLGGFLKLARIPFDFILYTLYAVGFAIALKVFGGAFSSANELESSGAVPANWAFLGYLILGAMFAYTATYLRGVRIPNIKLERIQWPRWKVPQMTGRKPANAWLTQKQRVYYTAALKFGARIAGADEQPEPREYSALVSYFSIDIKSFPQAREIYRDQLGCPEPMSKVIGDFTAVFGKSSAVSETFLIGMCKIAMADGEAHRREISLLRMAGDHLGIAPLDITRIMMAAGVLEQDMDAFYREYQNTQRNETQRPSGFGGAARTERSRHLATLGLSNGASAAEIKSAYRKLARKYHPDRLVSQGLPASELERAEDMMISINQAHEYLAK